MNKYILAKLKKKYTNVYKYTTNKVDYIYVELNMGISNMISIIEDPLEKEVTILKYGLVSHSINFDTIPSGIVETLINLIHAVTDSGIESIVERVQAIRDERGLADDYSKWRSQLIKVLNYKPEDVDNMNVDQFAKALVDAEDVLGAPLVATGVEDKTSSNTESPDDLITAYNAAKRKRFKKGS